MPPRGVTRSALSRRASRTCRSRSGSARTTAGAGCAVTVIPALRARACQASAVAGDQRREVDVRDGDPEVVGLEPGEGEQVGDVARHPVGLADQRRADLARVLGRHRPVGQALGVAAHRRQRRTQLVGDRQQEAPLPLLARGEGRIELAQGLGHRDDLGRAGRRHGDPALAGREPPGRGRGLGERRRQPPRQPRGQGERDERPEAEREHHATAYGREGVIGAATSAASTTAPPPRGGAGLDEDGYAVELAAGRDGVAGPQPARPPPRSGRRRRRRRGRR